ncbi:MAG TPA: DUF2452 domain-containing protein [Polyangiaceae bacterium]|jgi:hypothetical protein|nr:DUF2452 domain-containing protein [Polyangiaceae bacterium]
MTDDQARPEDEPNDNPVKLVEGRYRGPSAAAPYPLSRLAPSFALVDVAREIQLADETIATMTSGKLVVLAEQIRALQDKARALLEKARTDAELHRARCAFEKKPGGIYHLYTEPSGTRWFSLFGPDEWRTGAPPGYAGSFRLEADQSFTPVSDIPARDVEVASLARLLGTGDPEPR